MGNVCCKCFGWRTKKPAPGPLDPPPSPPSEKSLSEKSPEKAPSEKSLSGKSPSEKTPSEKSPSDKTPSEKSPSEKTPSEKSLSEKLPSEKTPSEKTPSEKTPSEKTPSEKTLSEETPKYAPIMAILKTGVTAARYAIEKFGPALPFPGDHAATLVLAVFDVVDTVVANKANVEELRGRAVAFLDVLYAYHTVLQEVEYKKVVDEYTGVLEDIKGYARVYTERNCVVRLLTGAADAEHYEELVAKMRSLHDLVMLMLSAEGNKRLAEVAADVKESQALLKEIAKYKDPAAAARELVAELGGASEVVKDKAKLARVMAKMDVGTQMMIEAVSALLESHFDKTPQRHIRQSDLRLMWKNQFPVEAQVPWFAFWDMFPEVLADMPPGLESKVVEQLTVLLKGDDGGAAQRAFQAALEQDDGGTVSVYELKKAFTVDEALLPQVQRLLGRTGAANASTAAAVPATTPQPTLGSADCVPATAPAPPYLDPSAIPVTVAAAVPAASPAAARCQLPPLAAHFSGRDEEAEDLAAHLRTHGSVLLLAPGGMGKSSLAADVGWRLLRGGHTPRGALWVDLREASSRAEVEARFCASLGIQPEKSGNTPFILKALEKLGMGPVAGPGSESAAAAPVGLASGGDHCMAALVVVDNAEDALLGEDAATALRDIVRQALQRVPGVRLLLTSRVSLGLATDRSDTASQHSEHSPQAPQQLLLTERKVISMSPAAAAALVRSIAEDLTEPDADRVAACCCGVPLVLCLVAEALVAGRLAVEDLHQLAVPATGATTGGAAVGAATATATEPSVADVTASTVTLVLRSLKRQHLLAAAYVAVFPSAFDAEAAAEMLGYSLVSQAHSTLSVLRRNSVLQRGGSGNGESYIMHMVVRQELTALARALDADLQRRAEGRFVRRMLHLLGEWATMYRTATEWRLALAAARDATADIAKLLELLEDGGEGAGVDPCEVAAALTGDLRLLFDGLGLLARLERPCRGLLRRLEGNDADPSAEEGPEGDAGGAGDASAGLGRAVQQQQQQDGAAPAATQLAVASTLFMFAWTKMRAPPKKAGEPAARRAWRLRCQLLGARDPATASALSILAILINETDRKSRCEEAEVLYRACLEVRRGELGEDHPDTVASVLSLAICLKDQRRLKPAQELYEHVVAARQRLLGDMHPDTAASYNYLAVCLKMQQRLPEAEQLYRRAVAVGARALGRDHRQVATYLANLGNCMAAQGRQLDREAALAGQLGA